MLTRYKLAIDPDTNKPFMKADPDGIYYSIGEVDREIDKQDGCIRERDFMIRRLATSIWNDELESTVQKDKNVWKKWMECECNKLIGGSFRIEGCYYKDIFTEPSYVDKCVDLIRRLRDAACQDCKEFWDALGLAEPNAPKCLNADTEGICSVWSDKEVKQPCVEGPCLDSKFEYGNAIELTGPIDLYAVDPNIEKWRKELHEYAAGTHVGGRVPEAERPSAGPDCLGSEEDNPE